MELWLLSCNYLHPSPTLSKIPSELNAKLREHVAQETRVLQTAPSSLLCSAERSCAKSRKPQISEIQSAGTSAKLHRREGKKCFTRACPPEPTASPPLHRLPARAASHSAAIAGWLESTIHILKVKDERPHVIICHPPPKTSVRGSEGQRTSREGKSRVHPDGQKGVNGTLPVDSRVFSSTSRGDGCGHANGELGKARAQGYSKQNATETIHRFQNSPLLHKLSLCNEGVPRTLDTQTVSVRRDGLGNTLPSAPLHAHRSGQSLDR